MDKHDIKRLLRILRKEIPSPKFQCKQCGKCCGPVAVIQTEMIQILNHISDYGLWKEVYNNLRERQSSASPEGRITCPLLRTMPDGKTQCIVYRVRPIVCRLQAIEKELPCPNNQNGYPSWKHSKYYDKYYEIITQSKVSITDGLMRGIKILQDRARPPMPNLPPKPIPAEPTESPVLQEGVKKQDDTL